MLNRTELIGHLGQAPKMAQTGSGKPVAQFSLATTEKWKDEKGQLQEKTEWHRIVVFGQQAEQCQRYLEKGSLVFLEGKLQTREWENRDGAKQHTTEIVAMSVKFLSPRRQGTGPEQTPAHQDNPQPASTNTDIDGFPF